MGLVRLSSLRLWNHVADQFSHFELTRDKKQLKWTVDCQDRNWSRFAGICCCQTVPPRVGWDRWNLPAQDQHGFRHEHLTILALLQLTTDIAVGFNQRKPLDRTVCVAVDLSAVFAITTCYQRSQLPPAIVRGLSCYLRGRQAKTCFRGVKSTSRKVNTKGCFRGVKSTSRKVNTKGSKLSPSLFSFYIADMPRMTDPVKRVIYADDLTVWASGVNIPDLEVNINNYLEEITAYLKDNSLLISAPKSSVTLLTHQTKTHPSIFIEDSCLPLVKYPKILGVYLDPSLLFNKHSQYGAERVSGRNNILKALAGTSWGQQKETLLMTYKPVGRSITIYAHLFGVQTYTTQTTEKSNIHRTRLWILPLDVIRCPVSITNTQNQRCWKLENTPSNNLHSTYLLDLVRLHLIGSQGIHVVTSI